MSKHWIEVGRKIAAERWTANKRANPQVIFASAVDEDTGTIIGLCQWNVYHPSIPQPQHEIEGEETAYEEDDDVSWCKEIIADLVRWRDITLADEPSVQSVVGSTAAGRKCYGMSGCVAMVPSAELKVSEGFKDRPEQYFAWMMRLGRGQTNEDLPLF